MKRGKTGFLLMAMTGTLGHTSGTVIVAGSEWMMGPAPSCSPVPPKFGGIEGGFAASSEPSLFWDENWRDWKNVEG